MKVVLDTNVLVSGLHTPGGRCSEVLRLVRKRLLAPCVDARILAEYDEVLHRLDRLIPPDEADEMCRVLQEISTVVDPLPLARKLPHLTDVPFLEVAKSSGATLVTGNLRHFPRRQRAGVRVLSPGELLDLLGQEGHGSMCTKEKPG